ncbi:Glycosyl transferase family 2 [uncultured archaeon]|nr:Glycosyl transferase family 2 [uncultured archaeon]
MTYPAVTIIILNWNGKEDTIECLESLKQITYPNYEILLVDNGSTDGSVECFMKQYPEIEIIETGKNLGFAEGNNVAIRRAMDEGVDYVLLLNNDTVVDPEFLGELVKVAEGDERIGIVGPKIYYYDYKGRKDVIWFAGGTINMWTGTTLHEGENMPDSQNYGRLKEIEYATGCAMLIKRGVIGSIGMLESAFFTYYEDVEISFRARTDGWNIKYIPAARVWHKVSQSSGGAFSSNTVYYKARNRIWFMRMYKSKIGYFITILHLLIFKQITRFIHFAVIRRDYVLLKNYYRGIYDGITKKHH